MCFNLIKATDQFSQTESFVECFKYIEKDGTPFHFDTGFRYRRGTLYVQREPISITMSRNSYDGNIEANVHRAYHSLMQPAANRTEYKIFFIPPGAMHLSNTYEYDSDQIIYPYRRPVRLLRKLMGLNPYYSSVEYTD